MNEDDWVKGDLLNINIPAHEQALRAGGETFLTQAFRTAGTLASDNAVARITRCEECPGGSTGRKLLLSVEFEQPSPTLHNELFVKFSRDFDNPIRDQLKDQLEPEVRLALLSQNPAFPIAVPACSFADYHQASGTGILITERIPFGTGNIEPLYEKCLDYQVPHLLEHYQVIIKALATLAGTQKSGVLAEPVQRYFPFDRNQQTFNQPLRYNLEQLQRRLRKFEDFAAQFPQLVTTTISAPEILSKFSAELPLLLDRKATIQTLLLSNPDLIALTHWNGNIDNAWFWRNERGELECGLMDWGSVSQMNLGQALWGALSAAETNIWTTHLDELLDIFAAQYQRAGGAPLDVNQLKLHTQLAAVLLSLSWLMDAPALIQRQISNLDTVENRFDPRFQTNETARTQLQMLTNFLTIWSALDLDEALGHIK